jgi:CBS domain-containing protein
MTREVVVMPPEADLTEVAEAMLNNDVRSVPVMDETLALAGTISRRDILRSLVRTDDMIQMDVQHRLDDYANGHRQWTATTDNGAVGITGRFTDDVQKRIVDILARTVSGMTTVEFRPS